MADNNQRVYGVAACRAVARARPLDVRRAFLEEARLREFGWFVEDMARRRLGYNIVSAEDLERITGGVHHEGVCFYVDPAPTPSFDDVLERAAAAQRAQSDEPLRVLYLDGVRNPHNLGAILRTAAHFGVDALLVPASSTPGLGPAGTRVAEGAAEAVPLIRLNRPLDALAALKERGVPLFVADAHQGESVFDTRLPKRCVLALGAEREGISEGLRKLAQRALFIPGTGDVESLNVAAAASVLLAEHVRQSGLARPTSGRA
ncbi:MAG: RNA methyltransferase [Sandaracinaceae bacterium]|nr:RNA methyltransferase [Sandaracinaceae bacterium]